MHVVPELGDDGPLFKFPQKNPITFNASDLDVTLVEVVASAELSANSKDIVHLEEVVWQELSDHGMLQS